MGHPGRGMGAKREKSQEKGGVEGRTLTWEVGQGLAEGMECSQWLAVTHWLGVPRPGRPAPQPKAEVKAALLLLSQSYQWPQAVPEGRSPDV